jgi:isoleucyl-tRNA synthetase
MFEKADDPGFVSGEHQVLKFWRDRNIFRRLKDRNAGKPIWSFLDGPITANNPMGVHHAWGRTYKDAFQRYFAMLGRDQRFQNGFDCQGLWVEVEVEKELKLGTKKAIEDYGIDRFVRECKKRVLTFAARQTEQSIRLGYWMEWDDPDELRKLAGGVRENKPVSYTTARGQQISEPAEEIVAKLGNADWGGSYFTFSTENNETIWTFLKKCFKRGKVYQGHDVMPWSGRGGSAYSQMEVADGRKLTVHRSCFVKFPIVDKNGELPEGFDRPNDDWQKSKEFLLVWTTTPWTLTSNVAAAVNTELPYVRVKSKKDGAVYYFAKDNLDSKRMEREFKEGFGRPEWSWPEGVPKLKSLSQLFKELGGFEVEAELKGAEMVGWRYRGPFDELDAQKAAGGVPKSVRQNVDLFDSYATPVAQMFGGSEPMYRECWSGDSFFNAQYGDSEIAAHFRSLGPSGHRLEIRERESVEVQHDPEYLAEYPNPDDRKWVADDAANVHETRRRFDSNRVGIVQRFIMRFLNLTRDLMAVAFPSVKAISVGKASIAELDGLFRQFGLNVRQQSFWVDLQAILEITDFFVQGWVPGDTRSNEEYRKLLSALPSWSSVHPSDGEIDDSIGLELWDRMRRFLYDLAMEVHRLPDRSGSECHRVIDGGRDSRGNANVTAGEGTGIVHIAPGCGDVDHKIGEELGLISIAPLKEDGTFDEGFNDPDPNGKAQFTGRNSIDPETPSLVFESLKEKELLFYVEQYPHIYPFCWRTGDELVFRLVDEWFINMDWRDEIKDVTKSIEWLPASLQGQERELEWLTTMRDWMISKKRFWGLALPIWVNPTDSTDFEVIGSLAELKERAVEGWNGFEGHTPHRPWIDGVKIRSAKTGVVLSRVQDVGNPWLDAGIVPFSTMQYNTNRDAWEKWYPADLVTESFPGQFRNWFYSLLSLATMMRYDEADDAIDKRPFKTLFGYRLVMNEEGQPMHKSDGTAIWFEEAAEQLGVDALRWLYLSQNPAQDLRFGTRHPNDHVTIETPEGPISETKEGVPCCKVTSKPVDEVRRQVLIPLWNSYAFFVNYARLDNFTPELPKVPVAERPEIDRWLLSNLQSLTATCRAGFETFDTGIVTKAAAEFIDDLSNWYIRRNRKRFWRSREEGSGVRNQESDRKVAAASRQVLPSTNHPLPTSKWDSDKLAAYQTLYETLVALTKLLAPCIPFLAERMYQNLVVGVGEARGQTPEASEGSGIRNQGSGEVLPTTHYPLPTDSVHLCDYPSPDAALLDESLNHRMATAQRVVTMGHRLREGADRRVRQPLAELKYASSNAQDADDIARLRDVIADELNVKTITRAENLDDLVHYSYKPNLKTLGPKLGKLLNAVKTALPTIDEKTLAPLRRGQPVTVDISGQSVTLAPEDVMVSTEQATEWASADDAGIQIALSTVLTPELIREGMARDLIRQVQQLRKDHDLDENEQIVICWDAGDREELSSVLTQWRDTIQTETRAARIEERRVVDAKAVQIGGGEIALAIERLS